MRKRTHLFFHGASILVSVGVYLMHRFETVGVFAHFLCVKNAKTPSIWSSGQDILLMEASSFTSRCMHDPSFMALALIVSEN